MTAEELYKPLHFSRLRDLIEVRTAGSVNIMRFPLHLASRLLYSEVTGFEDLRNRTPYRKVAIGRKR